MNFKKMNILNGIAAALFLSLFSAKSLAIVELSALLGYTSSNPSVAANPQPTVTGRSAFSYGIYGDIKIPESSYGLGVGLLNVTSAAHQSGAGFDLDVKAPYWQLPVTIQYWFADYLTVGIGAYYAFPGGQVNQSGTILGVSVNQSQDFATANTKTDDYGLVAGAGLYVPIGLVTSITARLLYEYGLENDSTSSGVTVHQSNILFYAGLAFGI